MSQLEVIAENFVEKYLSENDHRYAEEKIPLKKSFLPNIINILEIIYSSGVAYGILKELGADIYKKIKQEIIKKYVKQNVKPYILLKRGEFMDIRQTIVAPKNSGITVIRGEDRDTTVIQAGKLRPLFTISKGAILFLVDATIEYEGSSIGLIKEEEAPSYFTNNVIFRQRNS